MPKTLQMEFLRGDIMWMCSRNEVKWIVEEFLAKYLNLNSVILTNELDDMLDDICFKYGMEVENIEENED